jgi:hypothetical protein
MPWNLKVELKEANRTVLITESGLDVCKNIEVALNYRYKYASDLELKISLDDTVIFEGDGLDITLEPVSCRINVPVPVDSTYYITCTDIEFEKEEDCAVCQNGHDDHEIEAHCLSGVLVGFRIILNPENTG